MTKHFTYFLLLSVTMLNCVANAQTQIEIINADEISFNKKISEDRQLLLGNVRTKHQGRYLNCDSAYYYAKENKIEAFNNIHIWQGDTLNLKGEYLLYHGDNQLAEIHENVVFTHKEMTLITKQLNYNFITEQGHFNTRATIKNKSKSLESTKGVYYSKSEKFDFYGDVLLLDNKQSLKADTLYYAMNTEYASFKSNGVIENEAYYITAEEGWIDQLNGTGFLSNKVEITQLQDNYKLFADSCIISHQLKRSKSYGNTLLQLPFNDDTLYLTSDTLFTDELTHLINAYYQVSFKTKVIAGYCDSLSFDTDSNFIYLNIEPVLWLDEFQLTADNIVLVLKDQLIDKAVLNNNSFISSELDSTSINQISGINMQANFSNNELNTINVSGNGESIYYIQDDETKETMGLNKIICSNMEISVENRDLKSIKFLEKPDATLYPIENISAEQRRLKQYKYYNKELILNVIETKSQVHKDF